MLLIIEINKHIYLFTAFGARKNIKKTNIFSLSG